MGGLGSARHTVLVGPLVSLFVVIHGPSFESSVHGPS